MSLGMGAFTRSCSIHAVHPDLRHNRIGTKLVALAAKAAKAAGCTVLHVDFRDELAPFYFDACGFKPTLAGLIQLE